MSSSDLKSVEELKVELRNLGREYEKLKKERESLEENIRVVEAEKSMLEKELEKCRTGYQEARQQLIREGIEKDMVIEELMREQREAGELIELQDTELMNFGVRVSNLEVAIARLMRLPIEIVSTGAFLMRERMDVEVSANGVNNPVNGGQNGGINVEEERMDVELLANGVSNPVNGGQNGGINVGNLLNGVINHRQGENGGFTFESVYGELSDENALPQFARYSAGNHGPDSSIEGQANSEIAANGHDNAEVSSGARQLDCPQVESVASDQEEESDESPDTDFNDKELLQTKVRMMNGQNVVQSSCDLQAACDAPQLGTNGFSLVKENIMPRAASILIFGLI
ncbi:hypothetical protein ACH5RR_038349 [Cinchona calisaya]|uniref:Uncharacterized protein n=1 Tax=Cinchona calisaya TaxID=153742 RepID=A0ABD2XXM3_9GENT